MTVRDITERHQPVDQLRAIDRANVLALCVRALAEVADLKDDALLQILAVQMREQVNELHKALGNDAPF